MHAPVSNFIAVCSDANLAPGAEFCAFHTYKLLFYYFCVYQTVISGNNHGVKLSKSKSVFVTKLYFKNLANSQICFNCIKKRILNLIYIPIYVLGLPPKRIAVFISIHNTNESNIIFFW